MQVQVSFEDCDYLRKEEIEALQEDAQAVLKYRGVIDRALNDQMGQTFSVQCRAKPREDEHE